ncbi:MAG TPA: hypothetical protein PKD32_09050 [Saprospiraceae bacterium]|nr:hypothetical protein [Saprospiraceae bacterium]
MKQILYLYLLILFPFSFLNSQSKVKLASSKDNKKVLYDSRYKLPTPDRLAFVDSLLIEGKSARGHSYYGYTKAKLNGKLWTSFPKGHSNSENFYGIGSKELDLVKGNQIGNFVFAIYHKIITRYYIGDNLLRTMDCAFFKNGEDGCTLEESYKLTSSNKPNFIKIVSYDEKTGIFKARFRLVFKRESNNESYPEYLFFDDGVIYTKVFKQ